MRKWFKASLALSFCLFLIFTFSVRFGTMPPAGDFLNPFQGFWQNMAHVGLKKTYRIRASELRDNVTVVFDERGVPSIFAQNDHDLYFAMGYVQARDRLWQLDFQTRAAAGRLSEIIGPQAIGYDLYQRRIGMGFGAENSAHAMLANDTTRLILEAYTAGINHFIRDLRKAHRPLEYKLLDYEPEYFTPLKVAYLLMYMSQTLNFQTHAPRVSVSRSLLPDHLFEILFPESPYFPEPVMAEFEPVSEPIRRNKPEGLFTPAYPQSLQLRGSEPGAGSNNWALSGDKTALGVPILVNDPHLSLTLPSIWYEMQLHSPEVHVRGATLLGAPGVVIGMNPHTAWGTTNAGSFATDIYEIEFRDEHRMAYWYDGEWKPVTLRIEEITVRGAPNVIDTVRYTHHGPVMTDHFDLGNRRIPGGHAIGWIAHQSSNEILAFYYMNRAHNLSSFMKGMAHFLKPSQNWVYADIHGDIAMINAGKFPVRFHRQGFEISDGRNPAYDWESWIPFAHMPKEINPERGFVSSANQEIVSSEYPYFLGDFYANYERGRRINTLLDKTNGATVSDMEVMLLDNHSLHAENALPIMLSHLTESSKDVFESNILEKLRSWNFKYDADEPMPHFFDYWWGRFEHRLWKPLTDSLEAAAMRPSRATTVYLMKHNRHEAFLVPFDSVLTTTFNETVSDFRTWYSEDISQWRYGTMRTARIAHLANLNGFGLQMTKGGTSEAINAYRGTHGPSWRMIVELTTPPRARVVYPGGQTGNSAHRNYTAMIPAWQDGLFFDMTLTSHPDSVGYHSKTLRLRP